MSRSSDATAEVFRRYGIGLFLGGTGEPGRVGYENQFLLTLGAESTIVPDFYVGWVMDRSSTWVYGVTFRHGFESRLAGSQERE